MRVEILRRQSRDAESYWECFDYDGPADNTVAGVLEYLNYNDDICTSDGKKTTRISWDCSCLQGMCGACAMVINGVPALACTTFLKDIRGRKLELRPLSKFPVVKDLVVDRSSIYEHLRDTNAYIGHYQRSTFSARELEHQFLAAGCLKCGLCLEVCPNYTSGRDFFGAVFANECYLVKSRGTTRAGDMKRAYDEHFGNSCSNALSCMKVCPAGIPSIASIAKMNRSSTS